VKRTLLSQLVLRRVPHVVGVALAAGWGLLEFTDWAVTRFELDPSLTIAVMLVWAALLPVAGLTAWKLGAQLSLPQPLPAEDLPLRSVAVLPFVNGSGNAEAEYLCLGIADEILAALGRIADLKVVSRTSSFAQGQNGDDVRTIGHRLGVRCILEGSILAVDRRLRVTTQLIDVRDGYRLWSERYDREMEDIFQIRDDIAESVADALQVVLKDAERKAATRPRTGVLEAYERYVRGRQFMKEMRRKSFEYAREMFQAAVELDPGYALAHAGLAEVAARTAMFYPAAAVNLEEAERSSRTALELDPELAEAHSAHGAVLFMSGRIADAEASFKRALELDPQHCETLYLYGRSCFQEGRPKEAAQYFQRAFSIREDYDSAFFAAQSWEALDEGDTARQAYGEAARAAATHMGLNPDDARAATMRAVALCRTGHVDDGLRWGERALSIDPEDAGVRYNVACLYAQADRADEAVRHLQRALRSGFGNRSWLERDPDLDPIRDDSRFQQMLSSL
jgi:TolB-like protein/Tfp pilus assembly protein PilF